MSTKAKVAEGAYVAGNGFTFGILTHDSPPPIGLWVGPAIDDFTSIVEAFGAVILGVVQGERGGDHGWGMYLIRLSADNLTELVAALNAWSRGEPKITGFSADSIEWWAREGNSF